MKVITFDQVYEMYRGSTVQQDFKSFSATNLEYGWSKTKAEQSAIDQIRCYRNQANRWANNNGYTVI